MSKQLNLYIWTEVFYDYTPGMAVAIAPDLEKAIELAVTDRGNKYLGPDADPDDYPSQAEYELRGNTPTIVPMNSKAKPQAWHVNGGG